jgi:nucleoside-diphosphate-sugar epimerase
MAPKTILITGASGEMGHGLITHLAARGNTRIIAIDLYAPEKDLEAKCFKVYTGDVKDYALLQSITATYDLDAIYHLAAVLSTKAERQPALAHRVNVDGTLNLLEIAVSQARQQGRAIKFMYPSSIAIYGLPNLATKTQAGRIQEHEWLEPRTMYGVNKLYGENLGRYYAHHYRQLDVETRAGGVDFRGLRFPGLISAATVPTGGTSDYAPEMLHHAAQGQPYACFVRADTRIPFMTMPDGIQALLRLEAAPHERLTRLVYNIGAFNPSAGEVGDLIRRAFPDADITFAPDPRRQGIVDSWPQDVDDSAARADWAWQPDYDLTRAFDDYLIPAVVKRYSG